MNKNYLILLLAVAIVLVGGYFAYAKYFPKQTDETDQNKDEQAQIQNYDQCIAAGNAVQESYPSVCRTKDGRSFTQDIGNELEKTNLIKIDNPRPNATISSPLTITGQARGTWFFEASFPVKLYDGAGKLIGQGIAEAQGEWMTDNFVAYKTTLKFTKPTTATGLLVLEKDNPSDLRENDDQLRVPVNF